MVSMIARKKLIRYGVKAGDAFTVSSKRLARLLFKLRKADYENEVDRPAGPKVHVPDPEAPPATSIFDTIDDGFNDGLEGTGDDAGRELGRVGQEDIDPEVTTPSENDDDEERAKQEIADARAEYKEVVGKQPFMGWDLATLREKIAEKKAETA